MKLINSTPELRDQSGQTKGMIFTSEEGGMQLLVVVATVGRHTRSYVVMGGNDIYDPVQAVRTALVSAGLMNAWRQGGRATTQDIDYYRSIAENFLRAFD